MNWKSKIKRALMKLTGYWFNKRRFLFSGIDMSRDIEKVSNEPINVIFDVGANIGQSVHWFKEHYPKASIYSFEPVKSSFLKLKENTKTYNNIYLEHKALGEVEDKVSIRLHNETEVYSTLNSLDQKLMNNEPNAPVEEIEVSTVDHYLQTNNIEYIDLLKLDVEKWEMSVLKGANRSLKEGKIKFVLSEVGFQASESRFTNFNELSSYLKSLHYSFVGLYEVRLHNNRAHFGNALFIYDPN